MRSFLLLASKTTDYTTKPCLLYTYYPENITYHKSKISYFTQRIIHNKIVIVILNRFQF